MPDFNLPGGRSLFSTPDVNTSIDDFTASITGKGLLQNNLYAVNIGLPQKHILFSDADKLNFLCCAASTPFYKLKEERAFYNHRERKFASGLDLDPIQLSFYVTGEGYQNAVSFFQFWHELVMIPIDDDGVVLPKGFLEYKQNYTADIDIMLLNAKGKIVNKFTLVNAYPTEISPLDLSFQQTDILRLSVRFNFDDIIYTVKQEEPTKFEKLLGQINSIKSKVAKVKKSVDVVKGQVGALKTRASEPVRSVKKEASKLANDKKVLKRETKKIKKAPVKLLTR